MNVVQDKPFWLEYSHPMFCLLGCDLITPVWRSALLLRFLAPALLSLRCQAKTFLLFRFLTKEVFIPFQLFYGLLLDCELFYVQLLFYVVFISMFLILITYYSYCFYLRVLGRQHITSLNTANNKFLPSYGNGIGGNFPFPKPLLHILVRHVSLSDQSKSLIQHTVFGIWIWMDHIWLKSWKLQSNLTVLS